MKKEKEIRKLLDNRFHLCVEYDEESNLVQWMLFRRYENGDSIFWSKDNKPLMKSDINTEEELYEFAKTHHKTDLEMVGRKTRTISLLLVALVSIINIFIGCEMLSVFVLTSDLWLMLWTLIDYIVYNKNLKVDMLEIRENWKISKEEKEHE